MQLVIGSRLLPWDCCELLSQCFNVSKLDCLSSSSGFNHLTLKNKQLVGIAQIDHIGCEIVTMSTILSDPVTGFIERS